MDVVFELARLVSSWQPGTRHFTRIPGGAFHDGFLNIFHTGDVSLEGRWRRTAGTGHESVESATGSSILGTENEENGLHRNARSFCIASLTLGTPTLGMTRETVLAYC